MTGQDRIDVHSHVVPPFWAEQLDSYGGDHSGTMTPTWWSPNGAIAFMDSQSIATSILSLTGCWISVDASTSTPHSRPARPRYLHSPRSCRTTTSCSVA